MLRPAVPSAHRLPSPAFSYMLPTIEDVPEDDPQEPDRAFRRGQAPAAFEVQEDDTPGRLDQSNEARHLNTQHSIRRTREVRWDELSREYDDLHEHPDLYVRSLHEPRKLVLDDEIISWDADDIARCDLFSIDNLAAMGTYGGPDDTIFGLMTPPDTGHGNTGLQIDLSRITSNFHNHHFDCPFDTSGRGIRIGLYNGLDVWIVLRPRDPNEPLPDGHGGRTTLPAQYRYQYLVHLAQELAQCGYGRVYCSDGRAVVKTASELRAVSNIL